MLRCDPDVLEAFSEDAAHFPDGRPLAVAAPTNEAEIVRVLQTRVPSWRSAHSRRLTGGATPMGDVVLSTSRMNRILEVRDDRVRVQAGVTLTDLDAALAPRGALLSARADVHRRLRRRDRRHQRGGRRDVQVRHDAGVGRSADGRPRQRRRARRRARRHARARRTDTSRSSCADRRVRVPVPRYQMPDVREAGRRLLRRTGRWT